jgi:hypothetical protein
MSHDASVGTADRLNHVKVVALALIASLAIMLVGITARATDDINGYGVVMVGQTMVQSNSDSGPAH